MPAELFVVDPAAALLIAVAAHRKVLAAAHLLDAARHGIAALVVHPRRDQVQHLVPLALHIRRQQQAAPRHGGQQHLQRQAQRLLPHALVPGQEVVLREACVEAAALNLTDPPDHRLDRRAVKLLHPRAQRRHVGIRGGAAPQHKGDQRVHRGRLAVELGQHVHAEAGGFEFLLPQVGQPHPGPDLCSGVFQAIHSSFRGRASALRGSGISVRH